MAIGWLLLPLESSEGQSLLELLMLVIPDIGMDAVLVWEICTRPLKSWMATLANLWVENLSCLSIVVLIEGN